MDKKSKKQKFSNAITFEDFILENRIKTNSSLNIVLWFCVITGPLIALGITAGLFVDITYLTCIMISLAIIALALVHKFLCKKFPESPVTSIFAFLAMDLVLIGMAKSNVGIYLSYFVVPLVSLLFLDKKMYFYTCAMNFFMMLFSLYFISSYQASLRIDYDSGLTWFINFASGMTIETCIMIIAGNALSNVSIRYFRKLYDNQNLLLENENLLNEQLIILNSLTDIYSQLLIIDFNQETIVSLDSASKKHEKIIFDKQQHCEIDQLLSNQIVIDQTKDFLEFTNLSTIQERMKKQKFITAEFMSSITGWIRLQYICIEQNNDLLPVRLIYTIQDIDDEKQKEENLKRISHTDELTRLYNRRAYEDAVKKYDNSPIENDFVLLSIDVNGLKVVNDNLGHAAGDELLKGASFCMLAVLGHTGTVYRTGGDEFLAILHTTNDCNEIVSQLTKISNNWHGNIVQDLALAIGFARSVDYPGAAIHELEKIADEKMYRNKELYYVSKGVDRRGQQKAYSAVCNSYTKILKINLTTDTYSIIKMNLNEQKQEYGFSEQISLWLQDFGNSGQVHPGDLKNYLEKTSLSYMCQYFAEGNSQLAIFYKRKTATSFHDVMMEIIPAEDYSNDNQSLYLYVKDIQK